MKSGIYRITCVVNGKVYIGSAQNLKKRWQQHRGLLENNAHYNRHLQHSWNKYGSEAFTWDVLEYVKDEYLIDREQYCLDLYQSAKREHGFNLYPTAGSPLGRVLSEESKEKIRIANLGKKAAPQTRAKMSETRRGKKLSPEWAENIRQGQLGKVISAETRTKLSLSMKGRKLSLETRAKQSAALRGRKHTPETRKAMSEARLGWVPSKETREKLRVANLGKRRDPESIKRQLESRRNGKGFKPSPEAIENMKKGWLKRAPMSEETKLKISLVQKGKPKGPGRKVSEEGRAKLRESHRRRKAEQRAEATFLRTGIKAAPPENPKRETQGKLFD